MIEPSVLDHKLHLYRPHRMRQQAAGLPERLVVCVDAGEGGAPAYDDRQAPPFVVEQVEQAPPRGLGCGAQEECNQDLLGRGKGGG